MPVLDHDVHPSVKIGEDHRYQCWNRPDRFALFYWAPQRIFHADGSFNTIPVRIPILTSHDCRYDGAGRDDPHCAGCRHFLASEYAKKINERA
jgi:hypothetical protein